MVMTERDTELCRMYTEGATMLELADHFKISRQRIRQIVRSAGVYVPYRDAHEHNGRDAYIGVNVTSEVKDALRAKAVGEGKSMSEFVSDKLEEIVE